MKRFLFLLIILPIFSNGQNIIDLFKIIPSEYVDDLSLENRELLLKKLKYYPPDNEPEKYVEVYSLVAVDTFKNFLRVEMGFETGQAGYVITELRSFTLKNGDKLLISSMIGGAHNSFQTVKFQQFEYHNKQLVKAKKDYLPTTIGLADFIKPSTPDSIIQKYKDYDFELTYELGYEYFLGMSNEHISYRFYSYSSMVDNLSVDNSWVLGNMIEFIWTGDGFLRKKVSWHKK